MEVSDSRGCILFQEHVALRVLAVNARRAMKETSARMNVPRGPSARAATPSAVVLEEKDAIISLETVTAMARSAAKEVVLLVSSFNSI